MARRTLAKPGPRDAPAGLDLTARERLEAWLLTGPAGRVWSFGRELASVVPILARHWVGKLRGR